MGENFFYVIIFAIPAILVAFVLHEMGHAWMAYYLGDPTAKYEGRLSFNPKVHIDPLGAVVLLVSMITSGGHFAVGWAKPVPYNPGYLKDPIRGGMMIALAGPLTNFILAALTGLLFKFGILSQSGFLGQFLFILVLTNVGLGVFNLLPIPPLDGWKVWQGILPRDIAYRMMDIEYRNPQVSNAILIGGILLLTFTSLGNIILGVPFSLLLHWFTSPINS